MRVLITGAAGYLGSTLARASLASGHEVLAVDSLIHGGEALVGLQGKPRFRFVKEDVRDSKSMEKLIREADALVHLAAIVGDPACARNPREAIAINQRASLALAELAESAGISRFIFASTCSNYGKMETEDGFVTETEPLRPVSLYAESKVAVERELLEKASLPATVLRFATLYGLAPRMRFDLTVNQFVLEMRMRGRIVVFGEKFWRPYVHVQDAARAILLVLESSDADVRGQVFNVGATAENYRKLDLVEIISERLPGTVVEYVHKDEDPRDYRVSFERIASTLGFKPEWTVPDGVDEIIGAFDDGLIEDPFHARHYNIPPADVL